MKWGRGPGGAEGRAKRPASQRTFLMTVPTRGRGCTQGAPGLPNKLIAVSNTNYRFQPLLRFQALGLICKSFIQPKFDSFCLLRLCLLPNIREQGEGLSWNRECLSLKQKLKQSYHLLKSYPWILQMCTGEGNYKVHCPASFPPPPHPNHNNKKWCLKGKQKQFMFSSHRPRNSQRLLAYGTDEIKSFTTA